MEEIIDWEDGSRFVIPARLGCLVVGQPFQAVVLTGWKPVPLKRVTNPECAWPNHLHCALQTQDTHG
jgi:hypothetical protein